MSDESDLKSHMDRVLHGEPLPHERLALACHAATLLLTACEGISLCPDAVLRTAMELRERERNRI